MKNYIVILLAVVAICTTSCRKPKKGSYDMTLSGTKVTTTNTSSGTTISTQAYSNQVSYTIKKSRKDHVDIGDMVWKRSGNTVSYVSTNISVGNFFSGNWTNGTSETIAITYDGTITDRETIRGNFVFTITRVDSQTEEVQATTGAFVLERK